MASRPTKVALLKAEMQRPSSSLLEETSADKQREPLDGRRQNDSSLKRRGDELGFHEREMKSLKRLDKGSSYQPLHLNVEKGGVQSPKHKDRGSASLGLLPSKGGLLPAKGGMLPATGGILPATGGILPANDWSKGPGVRLEGKEEETETRTGESEGQKKSSTVGSMLQLMRDYARSSEVAKERKKQKQRTGSLNQDVRQKKMRPDSLHRELETRRGQPAAGVAQELQEQRTETGMLQLKSGSLQQQMIMNGMVTSSGMEIMPSEAASSPLQFPPTSLQPYGDGQETSDVEVSRPLAIADGSRFKGVFRIGRKWRAGIHYRSKNLTFRVQETSQEAAKTFDRLFYKLRSSPERHMQQNFVLSEEEKRELDEMTVDECIAREKQDTPKAISTPKYVGVTEKFGRWSPQIKFCKTVLTFPALNSAKEAAKVADRAFYKLRKSPERHTRRNFPLSQEEKEELDAMTIEEFIHREKAGARSQAQIQLWKMRLRELKGEPRP